MTSIKMQNIEPFVDCCDVFEDPEQLRSHAAENGYLYFPGLLPVEDVLAAANKYIDPERLQLVIVGPINRVFETKNGEGGWELSDFGTVTPVFQKP